MKRYLKSKLVKTLAVVVVAGLAGAWSVGAVRDRQEVARMTKKMKTVCVGRFLIDFPDEAQVSPIRPSIDGFDIKTSDETDEAFSARVAAREGEIRAKPDRLGGKKNLESARDVKTDSGLVGKIFVHSRAVTEGTAAKGLELEHYRYEGVDVEAHVHGKGISVDFSSKDIDPKYIEDLPRLVDKLVANPGNRIPIEPGYCIDRAYFRDPLKADQLEQIMMSANLPSHPDVTFMLILAAGIKPARQGLLERTADVDKGMSLADKIRVSELRAAKRTIGGLVGEEVVERVVEENFSRGYSFWWEVNGVEDNVFIPHFVFRMSTGLGERGLPVPSSLSEGAAMALWDKITNSIRLRPTESPKVSAVQPATPSLGTVVSAGELAPSSGWYACSDGGDGIAVLGGQRQYLMQGQRMPQALLLPPPTWWEKVCGLQPSHESKTRTAWQLVDKRSRKRTAPNVALAPAVVAPAATTAAAAGAIEPKVLVGTYATTGKACPASGWWRSEESQALDGTRWFALGSLLPAATFAVPTGVFGKADGGTPKTMQRRGNWMLVRLAQAPEPAGDAGEVRDPAPGQAGTDSPEGSAT